MASRTGPQIIEAAIELYADYGYFGVTIRDLARKSRTTEGTIYRLFKSRENVFDEALSAVIARSLDPAQLVLMMFENQEKQEFASLVKAVVRRWYGSMPEQSARFLMHTYWSENPKWRERAYAPIEKIIELLAMSLERRPDKARARKLNAVAAARGVILALFQFKLVFRFKSGKQESEAVEGIIDCWLQGLSLAGGT